MDLWQLKIFCRVVELNSFSRAAKAIHLSQPTVSSHIKDLEEHFGCRLIDRLPKQAVTTRAGELLYDYARKILALGDEAEAALAEFNGTIKGRLSIGGSTIPGGYLLPRLIGAFVRKYPEVLLSLVVKDTRQIIAEVLSGHLELAVVGARTTDGKIRQEKLVEDELRLIVPADHPWAANETVSLDSLLTESFIIREPGSGTLTSIQVSLARKGYHIDDFKIAAEMGSTEAIRQGIKNRVGVSILSTLSVAEDLKAGSLKALEVEGLNLKRNFYLTRHRHRSLSPPAREFNEFIKQALPSLP
jgi:DNA-binding transcriptional LysR family regulator